MADWEAGDLALCVGPLDPGDGERGMFKGRIYTVTDYFPVSTGMVLHFAEPTRFTPWEGWNPDCFIKVTPPADMMEDTETIALSNRTPVPVGTGREG